MRTPERERLLAATDLDERHEDLAGIRTAILEGGEGPPMVLLHGQGEHWGVWMPVLGDLATTHRVVVVDLPGHGASTVLEGRLDRERVLTWVDELIAATCAEAPVVVGHLLGGGIAARYAVDRGDRLAHLVLVDTTGLAWFRPTLRFAVPMLAFMARPTERSRDRLFNQCVVDFDRTGANFGDRWEDLRAYALDRAQQPESQAALRALMPRFGVPPIPPDDLDRITTPTTLVHGRDDRQVRLAVARRASERHGWPLHVVEDCGDDPAAEQPATLVEVLRRVLADPASTPDPQR